MLYAVGQTLWRVPLMHLTPWDFNWPYRLPGDAVAPPGPRRWQQARPFDAPCTVTGSIWSVKTRSWAKRVGLVGRRTRSTIAATVLEGTTAAASACR